MPKQFYEAPFNGSRSILSGTSANKRKVDEADISDESSTEELRPKSSHSTWAELLPEDAHQRRTAGLAAEDEIPGNHFPNRPQDYKPYTGTYAAPSQVQKELASLKPPLVDYTQKEKQIEASRSSLKQQHINVLYTLVHKFLLDRDYIRAERAFGLLLRTENAGILPDLRSKNLWGIGAEILLYRKAQASTLSNYPEQVLTSTFSREGQEDVKQYFENLIVQFPYRSQYPDLLSVVHIYPVFFGLWIAFIDDKHRATVRSVRGGSMSSSASISIEQTEEINAIRKTTLTNAQEINQRLNTVLQSIPFSDNPVLWNLKGHVILWIHDLSRPSNDENLTKDLTERLSSDTIDEDLARSDAEKAFAKAAAYAKLKLQNRQAVQNNDLEEDRTSD